MSSSEQFWSAVVPYLWVAAYLLLSGLAFVKAVGISFWLNGWMAAPAPILAVIGLYFSAHGLYQLRGLLGMFK